MTELPQAGLRLRHGEIELALPTDRDLGALAAIVATPGAIVAPGEEHFVTWPTGTDEAEQGFLAYHRRQRVPPRPDEWLLLFAIHDGDEPVGVAGLHAARWGHDRVVDTRSWLARRVQGHGIGRRVRLLLLELAFSHLGADRAVTALAENNAASLRVSLACGYREYRRSVASDGVREIHLALTPERWRTHRLPDAGIEGAEPLRAALTPGDAPGPASS